MNGIIALDIDGTLVAGEAQIPPEVVEYLACRADEGWKLIFLTGRSYQHGMRVLESLPFAYHLAPQNGSALIAMPTGEILRRSYLSTEVIPAMTAICAEEDTDFAVYSGPDYDDYVYYRAARYSADDHAYLKDRMRRAQETWVELQDFDELHFENFPAVKCICDKPRSQRIASRMESELGLHTPVIRDPYHPQYCVAQGVHPEVSKGHALLSYVHMEEAEGLPVIAAGDDTNDLPLLKAAGIAIAMGGAPDSLRAVADILAPPASQQGIIAGLNKAIERSKR